MKKTKYKHKKPSQFGFIYFRGRYFSTDPIGDIIGKLSPQNLWHKWDKFYRCQLKIPYFLFKLEEWRFRR